MKKVITTLLFALVVLPSFGQYRVSSARTWDKFPPDVQEGGFGVHTSQLVQMDDSPAPEEVFLFSRDKGHYPYFDVFRVYYVIVDSYTKEVKYKSDEILTTERTLTLEDRNQDGMYELYRKYFKDGRFTVDAEGNHLQTTWSYDCIDFNKK